MAERRMISSKVLNNDVFASMSPSARCLYFTMISNADDDGFIGNPLMETRAAGCDKSDLEELIQNKYLLKFESGVVVIKHWLMHNSIRKDRYTKTSYIEELNLLYIDEKGAYTLRDTGKKVIFGNQNPTPCQPTDNQVTTENQNLGNQNPTPWQPKPETSSTESRLGKDRSEETMLGQNNNLQKINDCLNNKPSIGEIQQYIFETGREVNVNEFWEKTCGCSIYKGEVIYDWKGLIDRWVETEIAVPIE